MTSECPRKKLIIERGKDLCKEKVNLASSSQREKKNKPCVEARNIFKILCIQHKTKK